MAALVIGFDFAVREGFLRILGDPPAGAGHDRLAELLTASTAPASPVLGRCSRQPGGRRSSPSPKGLTRSKRAPRSSRWSSDSFVVTGNGLRHSARPRPVESRVGGGMGGWPAASGFAREWKST